MNPFDSAGRQEAPGVASALALLVALILAGALLFDMVRRPPRGDYGIVTKIRIHELEMGFYRAAGESFPHPAWLRGRLASDYAQFESAAPNHTNVGSEWLYRILKDDPEFASLSLCDTDGDGTESGDLMEFSDQWGNPIIFVPGIDRSPSHAYMTRSGTVVQVARHRQSAFYNMASLGVDGVPETSDDLHGGAP